MAADLISKLVADGLLPLQEYVPLIGDRIGFFLTYNLSGIGSHAESFMGYVNQSSPAVLSTYLSILLMWGYVVFVRKKRLKMIYKILSGLGLWLVLTILLAIMLMPFSDMSMPGWVAPVFGKLIGIIIWGTFFYWSSNRWVRLSILCVIACGLGNLLSYLYSPFLVIDFILIQGSYEMLRLGVFNVADLAYNAGLTGLALCLIAFIYRRIVRFFIRRTASNPQT